MCKYNKGDVILLERIYLCMRPYITLHPNVALINGKVHACPKCNSTNLQKRGFSYSRVSKTQRFQCNDCHGWSSAPIIKFNQEEKQVR